MTRIPTLVLAAIVPVAALVTAVVTLNVTSDDGAPAADAGGATISIEDFEFSPEPLRVAAGTTVTVTNLDDAAHTVTAEKQGAFDTGDIDGRGKAEFAVDRPGRYAYFCAIHDYMRGVIEVGE
jgi:plastocyanin